MSEPRGCKKSEKVPVFSFVMIYFILNNLRGFFFVLAQEGEFSQHIKEHFSLWETFKLNKSEKSWFSLEGDEKLLSEG